MKQLKKQRGASMWEMCLYIFVFLAVVTVALKLGPVYIQDRNIDSALNALNESAKGDVTGDVIKTRLSRTFQVSMIDDSILSNLTVDSSGVTPVVTLNYDVTTPFVGNVDVVIHFKHSINLTSAH